MEGLVKKLTDKDSVYYTIYWSRLKKTDKYEIISSVPSVAGIFELYYLDWKKKLNLFFVSKAWYGGLRNKIRKATDSELESDPARKHVLETFSIYYRYTAVNSYGDMSDIISFFSMTYFPHRTPVQSSGRYKTISVTEISKDKITTV